MAAEGATLATAPLVPARAWLDTLALVVPGATVTRWLLLADVVCLVGIALVSRYRWLAVSVALALGFIALNMLGFLLNDFFLALAAFHIVVAVTTLAVRPSAWWLGGTSLLLSLSLGALT